MRVNKGLDRHELAQATGISYSSLYRLESGMVKTPPLWWYQNCAIALGVKLEDILDYEHAGWHGTGRAPAPPSPAWLREKAKPKPAAPSSESTAKAPLRKGRLRPGALAARD